MAQQSDKHAHQPIHHGRHDVTNNWEEIPENDTIPPRYTPAGQHDYDERTPSPNRYRTSHWINTHHQSQHLQEPLHSHDNYFGPQFHNPGLDPLEEPLTPRSPNQFNQYYHQRRAARCWRCHLIGHFERDCKFPDPADPPQPSKCFKCGHEGHIQKYCWLRPMDDDERRTLTPPTQIRPPTPPRGYKEKTHYMTNQGNF